MSKRVLIGAVLVLILAQVALPGGLMQQLGLVSLADDTVISIQSAEVSIPVGDDIWIAVWIDLPPDDPQDPEANDLSGADVQVEFDPAVIQVLELAPVEETDPDFLLYHDSEFWNEINNEEGYVRYAVCQTGKPPATGSGALLRIHVRGLQDGATEVEFTRRDLSTIEGNPIPSSPTSGSIQVGTGAPTETPTPTSTPSPTHTINPGMGVRFLPKSRWTKQYRGFNTQDQYPRMVADADGDGYADVVAFHPNKGVWVSLSTGNAYASKSLWSTVYKTWTSQDALPRAVGDVDADGRADIAGFQPSKGIFVCLSNGVDGFGARKLWSKQFRKWNSQNQYPRMLADVDGDGDADAVGLHPGKGVFVALSNGASGFASRTLWSKQFRGWNTQEQFPRMLGDIDGDGDADIVGFHPSKGVYVALSNGVDGFALRQRWSTEFTDCTSQDAKPRMLADVNGDGYADIVAFKPDGVYVALSTGTSFAKSVLWSEAFGDYASQDAKPRALGNADGDGKADIVGFNPAKGVYVSLSGV